MPPASDIRTDPSHELPASPTRPMIPAHTQERKAHAGPIAGIIIIVLLMMFGALYFWGAYLNSRDAQSNLPLIPAETTQ